MKEKYIEECKMICQNCTYTAEAHHQMALSSQSWSFWTKVIPGSIAVLSGTAVSLGLIGIEYTILTTISSLVSVVSTVVKPEESYQTHLDAAKSFTTLKHDARYLWSAQEGKYSDEDFIENVNNLHNRYNELVKSVPPTNSKSFEKACKIIKAGIHDADKNKDGSVK